MNPRRTILNSFSYENANNDIHYFLKDKIVECLKASKSLLSKSTLILIDKARCRMVLNEHKNISSKTS